MMMHTFWKKKQKKTRQPASFPTVSMTMSLKWISAKPESLPSFGLVKSQDSKGLLQPFPLLLFPSLPHPFPSPVLSQSLERQVKESWVQIPFKSGFFFFFSYTGHFLKLKASLISVAMRDCLQTPSHSHLKKLQTQLAMTTMLFRKSNNLSSTILPRVTISLTGLTCC